MYKAILSIAAASALFAQAVPDFEQQPREWKARSPKMLARRAHGLLMIYTAGPDLMFQSTNDLGDTYTPPVRVNSVPGEVSDHGENSPILMSSPDDMSLYAVWNSRDKSGGSVVRFARSNAMQVNWSPAITVNDDGGDVSHGFQGAAVGPDGTIYVAWLDMRETRAGAAHDHSKHEAKGYTGGSAAVYLARSTDGGKTFGKNIRIAGDVCPCCRAAFGFVGNRVVVAWRGVETGDMRDIFVASSADKGETWSKPRLAMRDGWKIKGCPHVGPSMATLGQRLYMTWFSEAGGKPAIFAAYSTDNGETFAGRQLVSAGTMDPTHPQLAAGEDRLAIVFQARDAAQAKGWGKVGVYYREILASGALSKPVRVGQGKVTSNYPSVAVGMSGRVFVGWSESGEEGPRAYLVRGRRSGS